MTRVDIAGRQLGDGHPPFVIAEAGVNHNGQRALALDLVDAAAESGADAVKFQTFSANRLVTADAAQAAYQQHRAAASSQREMLRALELEPTALRAARDRATARGLLFLSTPFDIGAVELLAELEVPAYKIGSGDLTNVVLLRAVARHQRPVLLSTGMATLSEIDAAVAVLAAAGDPPLVLLQCTSAYPAPVASANLRAMDTLNERYGTPVGYSDHTDGIAVAIAASSLGAAVIEKHLTLNRSLPGPDHAASLEPAQFAAMAVGIRDAYDALGSPDKAPTDEERQNRQVARRSLVLTRALIAGEAISVSDLDAMRPAEGISPLRIDEVVGRHAAHGLPAGKPLQPSDLTPPLDG
jgi:N-acetylneuraminate synthase/N,N'-diacetyllegionaminate synthase